jgi:ribosomal-protein-alanine N-acetyltransferase
LQPRLACPNELRTERLILRRWRESDREPFARLNADPELMRYMIRALTCAESDAFVERIEREFEEQGYGLWAVEVPGETPLIGFVGLHRQTFPAHFTPAVEVGWRLDRPYWGRGYATEAARAALRDGFERVGLTEIVSMTTPANIRSIAVMERLGMTRNPADDFDHPNVPDGHPAKHHVLYRVSSKTGLLRAAPAGSSTMSRAPRTKRTKPPTRKRRT